jgi:hypothetical protein
MGSFISSTIPEKPVAGQLFSLTILDEYNLIDITRKYILVLNGQNFTDYTIMEPNIIVFNNVVSYISGEVTYYMYEMPDNPYINILEVAPICYSKGTQILCSIQNMEKYVNIENIRPGMLVKTYPDGYKKVIVIQKNFIQNTVDRIVNKMYKLSKHSHRNLINDLYITGPHSILVPQITPEQREKTIATWGQTIKIGNLYRLMAHLCPYFQDVKDNNLYEIYHLVLENTNEFSNYGIWANGILSESVSIETYKRLRLVHNNSIQIRKVL